MNNAHSKSVRPGTTTPPLAMPMATVTSTACPQCDTLKKSGKRSCCARGGAWFKKCGDAGDTNFDHTWTDGIQACKHFGSFIESTPQVMMLHAGVARHQPNTSRSKNVSHQQIRTVKNASHSPNPDITDSEESVGFTVVFVRIYILFIMSNLRM